MKHIKKIAALFAAGTCLVSSLTGCTKVVDEIVTSLVKWNLDPTYLNQHDETFLKMYDMTKEEAEADYLTGIGYDAENFAYYWGITDGEVINFADLEEDLQEEIINICKTISENVKYEVQSATVQDGSCYAVKVVVEPIDIMDQAETILMEETYEPINDFWEKYETMDAESFTDDVYFTFVNEYGYLIVDLMEELLPNLGYMDEKSMIIQLEEVDDMWEFNEDDMATFNEYVVYYP